MSDGATNDSEESDSANGSGRSGEPSLSADPIPESGAMLGLILRFLSGSESAMAALAVHPWSLRVGLAFVLLAGVAREYDGEDLLGEPWHLLVPLVASLVSCTLLFLLLNFGAWRKGVAREDRPGYLAFLRLFWLTAPLAKLMNTNGMETVSRARSVSCRSFDIISSSTAPSMRPAHGCSTDL